MPTTVWPLRARFDVVRIREGHARQPGPVLFHYTRSQGIHTIVLVGYDDDHENIMIIDPWWDRGPRKQPVRMASASARSTLASREAPPGPASFNTGKREGGLISRKQDGTQPVVAQEEPNQTEHAENNRTKELYINRRARAWRSRRQGSPLTRSLQGRKYAEHVEDRTGDLEDSDPQNNVLVISEPMEFPGDTIGRHQFDGPAEQQS